MKKQVILITGATGFIASHLIPLLDREKYFLKLAVRQDNITIENSCQVVNIGNIDNTTNWKSALKNVDIVIHLAARAHLVNDEHPDPESEFFRVNTRGTINLVKQSIEEGVKHFIFMSSIGAMATLSDKPLTEKTPCNPDTYYGRSKLKAEEALVKLASKSSMTYTILRPNLVYGKGNPGNMERLIKLIEKGLPLPFGSVKNSRSFIYVGNLVDAIITCLSHPRAKNQTFLVSDARDVSTPELIKKIAYYIESDCKLFPVPLTLLKLSGYLGDSLEYLSKKTLPLNSPTVERLLGSLVVDSSNIRQTLDWKPPYTLDRGLQKTLLDC